MAANDPIIVSSQNRQEQAALDELRPYLRPWRCTFVDQRDDFGRDGVVQIVDEGNEGKCFMSPLTFWVQCKSDAKPLADVHSDVVETRHLSLWTDQFSSPLFLIIWSAATREFRFRSAQSVREELDRSHANWRTQQTVTVHYRKHEGYDTAANARSAIRRILTNGLDSKGGLETFHTSKRRIVLTNLLRGTITTSQRVELSGKDKQSLLVGEGWLQGDLNPYEVSAEHALAASLLLFEEVWVPMGAIKTCFDLLGEKNLFDLLERERIKLYAPNNSFGFLSEAGATAGKIVTFNLASEVTVESSLKRFVGPNFPSPLLRSLASFVARPEEVNGSIIVEQTLQDLKHPNLRILLGLRPTVSDTEPVWDGALVNRLATINLVRALGACLRADVIQYEGGLSRLASEKDYDVYGLNRRFDSVKTFDQTLRTAGAPDLGQLLQRVPLLDLVALADTSQAQDFRDWYWSSAASLIGSGADLTATYLRQVELLVKDDLRAYRFPVRLKIRYLESIGGEYLLGRLSKLSSPAFATTADKGDEVVARQRANYARYRRIQIGLLSRIPGPYDQCPCSSGAKFRFCCGRSTSQLG